MKILVGGISTDKYHTYQGILNNLALKAVHIPAGNVVDRLPVADAAVIYNPDINDDLKNQIESKYTEATGTVCCNFVRLLVGEVEGCYPSLLLIERKD